MNLKCFFGFHDSAMPTPKILSSYGLPSHNSWAWFMCLRCQRFQWGFSETWRTADEILEKERRRGREHKRQEEEIKKIELSREFDDAQKGGI